MHLLRVSQNIEARKVIGAALVFQAIYVIEVPQVIVTMQVLKVT